jgi:hypothetical protein
MAAVLQLPAYISMRGFIERSTTKPINFFLRFCTGRTLRFWKKIQFWTTHPN